MPSKIELIGVYQLPVNEEMLRSQAELLYDAKLSVAQRDQARHQPKSNVLVQVPVSEAYADFRVADFAQENPSLPRGTWVVKSPTL